MFKNLSKKHVIAVVILGVLFIAVSYLSHRWSEELTAVMGRYPVGGAFLYVSAAFVSTVVAPVSMVPLIPLASLLWGPLLAAILSTLGWFLGAVVAFLLSRWFRGWFLGKFDYSSFSFLDNLFPGIRPFWRVALLRIIVPVDILSYGLGLFSSVSFSNYASGTLLGIIPFAFVFSYGATIPVKYQILGLVTTLVVLLSLWRKGTTTNMEV